MSGFLLDTNVPWEIIRSRHDQRVSDWIDAHDITELHLSVITVREFRKGLAMLHDGTRRSRLQDWLERDLIPLFAGRILPVTQAIAERWGMLSGQRHAAHSPLGMADGLIAATAIEHDLTVVTRNTRDYEGLGATVLNPWREV